MEDKFIRLTNSVYKILEFFPESDPLKNRAKDKALEIMENPTPEDIDMLLGYLWIAKTQGWINSVNYLIVSNGYEKIKKEISSIIEIISEPVSEPIQQKVEKIQPKAPPVPVLSNNISERQKQIINFLNKKGTAQVMELQTILPDVTKRTIRRDLDELLLKDKIVRMGEFNQVVYRVKG